MGIISLIASGVPGALPFSNMIYSNISGFKSSVPAATWYFPPQTSMSMILLAGVAQERGKHVKGHGAFSRKMLSNYLFKCRGVSVQGQMRRILDVNAHHSLILSYYRRRNCSRRSNLIEVSNQLIRIYASDNHENKNKRGK
jgi:hypothetical protein